METYCKAAATRTDTNCLFAGKMLHYKQHEVALCVLCRNFAHFAVKKDAKYNFYAVYSIKRNFTAL